MYIYIYIYIYTSRLFYVLGHYRKFIRIEKNIQVINLAVLCSYMFLRLLFFSDHNRIKMKRIVWRNLLEMFLDSTEIILFREAARILMSRDYNAADLSIHFETNELSSQTIFT